jgi:hypothetical protein
MARLVPAGFAAANRAGLDLGLLFFTLGLSLAAGVLFSIVPAPQISRTSLSDGLRQGGRGSVGGARAGTRDALVVLEVAAAFALLAGAGLTLKTMAKLRAIDIGFRPDRMLTMRTTLPREINRDPNRRLAFYDSVVDGVRTLPGVESAAYNSVLPFLRAGATQAYRVEGRDAVMAHHRRRSERRARARLRSRDAARGLCSVRAVRWLPSVCTV